MRTLYARTTASLLAAICVLGCLSQTVRAQNVAAMVAGTADGGRPPASGPQVRDLPIDILKDQRDIWTSPLRLHGDDAPWLLAFAGATAALVASDKEVNSNVSTDPDSVRASNRISNLGSGYTLFGGAAATYLIGRVTHNERARATGLLGIEALADSIIVVEVLKAATNRERPNKPNGRQDFYDGGNAFPSGHATSSWALAEVVAEQYRDRPVVRWSAYGLATAVGVARVTSLHHSPSDVFVGSVIGYLVGRHVVRRSEGSGSSHVIVTMTPVMDTPTRTFGIAGSISF